MRHRIGHQHQASIGALRPELDQEVAHLVAPPWQPELLQQRHHLLADEALHLRLLLEGFGLRARMTHERPRPFDDVGGWNAQLAVVGLAIVSVLGSLARYDWSIHGEMRRSVHRISSVIAMLSSASVMIGTNRSAVLKVLP